MVLSSWRKLATAPTPMVEGNKANNIEEPTRDTTSSKNFDVAKIDIARWTVPSCRVPPKTTFANLQVEKIMNIKILGQGSFGTVNGCMYDNKACAVKKIHKKRLFHSRDHSGLVWAERYLMILTSRSTENGAKFLVTLECAFQTLTHLYFVIPYYPGGDLATLYMKQRHLFTPHVVLYYMSHLVSGLMLLHSKGIYHRDIKPDNVFVDVNGHAILGDFGLSVKVQGIDKYGTDQHAHFWGKCGSLGYRAPEVALELICGPDADTYSLGVTMYYLLRGKRPAKSTFARLTSAHSKIRWPSRRSIPEPVRRLCEALLEIEPASRIPLDRVRYHAAYQGIDWDALMKGEYMAPWIPPNEMVTDSKTPPKPLISLNEIDEEPISARNQRLFEGFEWHKQQVGGDASFHNVNRSEYCSPTRSISTSTQSPQRRSPSQALTTSDEYDDLTESPSLLQESPSLLQESPQPRTPNFSVFRLPYTQNTEQNENEQSSRDSRSRDSRDGRRDHDESSGRSSGRSWADRADRADRADPRADLRAGLRSGPLRVRGDAPASAPLLSRCLNDVKHKQQQTRLDSNQKRERAAKQEKRRQLRLLEKQKREREKAKQEQAEQQRDREKDKAMLMSSHPTYIKAAERDEGRTASITLNDSSFVPDVLEASDLWLVQFVTPGCTICKNLSPQWKKASVSLEGKVKFGTVDCTASDSSATKEKYKITACPTIAFFSRGERIAYGGSLIAEGIISKCLSQLEEHQKERESQLQSQSQSQSQSKSKSKSKVGRTPERTGGEAADAVDTDAAAACMNPAPKDYTGVELEKKKQKPNKLTPLTKPRKLTPSMLYRGTLMKLKKGRSKSKSKVEA